jgi:hypothetical protein
MIEAIPSTISHVKTMAGGLRIYVDTQENMSPDTIAKVFGLKDKLGWFFFAEHEEKLPDKIDAAKLPEIQLEEGEKSPGQRLRATLYVYWEQNIKGKPGAIGGPDFELFYRQQMEKIINQVKERLA